MITTLIEKYQDYKTRKNIDIINGFFGIIEEQSNKVINNKPLTEAQFLSFIGMLFTSTIIIMFGTTFLLIILSKGH